MKEGCQEEIRLILFNHFILIFSLFLIQFSDYHKILILLLLFIWRIIFKNIYFFLSEILEQFLIILQWILGILRIFIKRFISCLIFVKHAFLKNILISHFIGRTFFQNIKSIFLWRMIDIYILLEILYILFWLIKFIFVLIQKHLLLKIKFNGLVQTWDFT